MPELSPIYLIYAGAAITGIMIAEAIYLLFASGKDRRAAINRRMKLQEKKISQEEVLIQLRKERGLDGGASLFSFDRFRALRTQSGLVTPMPRFLTITSGIAAAIALVAVWYGLPLLYALMAMPVVAAVIPLIVLRFLRGRRHKRFGIQLPEALELITRSLKAGHPVPVAISMVAREMPDPIGTEFGVVADEVTYGSDLVSALHSMYSRVGHEDLPLFVTAVSIQNTSGGNLREILDGLATVIRERGKLRRKVRAISTEGRMSAYILTAVPALLMVGIMVLMPSFYESVWDKPMTWYLIGASLVWLMIGNAMMFKMSELPVLGETMESVLELLASLKPTSMMPVAIFMLLAGAAAVGWPLLAGGEGRSDIKRRLKVETAVPARTEQAEPQPKKNPNAVREKAVRTAQEFYAKSDPENVARLRMKLIQAGYMDPRAVGAFFLVRFGAFAGFALFAILAEQWTAGDASSFTRWAFVIMAGAFGYFLPGFVLMRKVRTKMREYRNGFPDFMDLMIVCSDAGMSMEAGIERVSKELGKTYPSLSHNLALVSLELRAGRSLDDALKSLADRLSLDEVRSFATLLQQSKELGTSLAGALRVFSDEMRHKRMSLAEEKAHALPAKMSVPVTVCILPVVLMIAIIPIIVKMTAE